MNPYAASHECFDLYSNLSYSSDACSYLYSHLPSLRYACANLSILQVEMERYKDSSEMEGKYSAPMALIGIYISIASLFCILAMTLDLMNGLRNRKFWFPTKYFSLNAASITVITVAMKLPVDLTSPMLGAMDQVAKVGSLAFMCTMMANLMPSLASMDNKSVIANVAGISILVITVIVNVLIQVRTLLIGGDILYYFFSFKMLAYIYMVMLLLLLLILISSAITIPTSKKILDLKYQAISKKTLNDQFPQENRISIVDKLRQLVKGYWIMTETGSPQFVMAGNPLSSASSIICVISTAMHACLMCNVVLWADFSTFSVYKRSTILIVITQSFGVVVGSIAPIFRCFTLLSFKSFTNRNTSHFLVFKVEKYWSQKLSEWKESHISILSSNRRSRALLRNLKNLILSLCIGFQKIIVVSCKTIGLLPVVVIIFIVYFSYYFKSMKAMLFTLSADDDTDEDEDLSRYVLLLEDNMQLAEKTMKGISDSMNRLIHKAEKKQHNNLLKLLEKSIAFDGVEMFDTDQIQSLLPVELVNSWSLPIISLTCIAIVIPNIHKDKVDNLFKSVCEGLSYTNLVEESLNKAFEFVNIRRATITLWHEVEDNRKWLGNTLKRSGYEGKTPKEIISSFSQKSKEIVNEFNISTKGEPVDKENLPLKLIAANSMHRIAETIIHTYKSNNLEILEDELFTRLSSMIADILAACFTNLPRVITMRCHETAIEKREASVVAAVNLFGRTTEIMKRLETRELPIMNLDKMGFIDEWRFHLKQP